MSHWHHEGQLHFYPLACVSLPHAFLDVTDQLVYINYIYPALKASQWECVAGPGSATAN